jgi:hypothetical protein
MIEGPAAPEQRHEDAPPTDTRNTLPVVITVAVLGIMAVVIAIDFQSVPALAVLTVVSIGGLIAAYAVYG